MPYLLESFRQEIKTKGELDQLSNYMSSLGDEHFCGALNYIIHVIVKEYFTRKGLKYYRLNSVIGALQCASLEIYRVLGAKYENQKRAQNGEV